MKEGLRIKCTGDRYFPIRIIPPPSRIDYTIAEAENIMVEIAMAIDKAKGMNQ